MIAIVGAGACGLVAALTLKDAGVECVVLERDALPSGSTALSSGFIPACGTRWQKARGVEDSPALLRADIENKNRSGSDSAVVQAVVGVIGPTLEWLADRHGLEFGLLEGFLYPGHSVARMHAVPEKTGLGLMGRLLAAAQRGGVDILTDARVFELVSGARGDITGLSLMRPDGSIEAVDCDALLLACNGFGGNVEMVRRYIPEIAEAEYAGHRGNQGDAVRWGEALGAKLADMGAYQGHGAWAVPHGKLLTWALVSEGALRLNSSGEPVGDASEGYSEASQYVLKQPGRIAWTIYDERLHKLGLTFPDYVELEAAGAVRKASDAQQLARVTGIPLEAIERESRKFAPPYYAVKVTGALFHTQGGLEVDADARVLGLPDLYAGGGAARGLSGGHVWGYLSGNGLLSAVALGRIAGENLVKFASRAA